MYVSYACLLKTLSLQGFSTKGKSLAVPGKAINYDLFMGAVLSRKKHAMRTLDMWMCVYDDALIISWLRCGQFCRCRMLGYF